MLSEAPLGVPQIVKFRGKEKVNGNIVSKLIVQNTQEDCESGTIYDVGYFSNGKAYNFKVNHQRSEGKEKLLSLVYEKLSELIKK